MPTASVHQLAAWLERRCACLRDLEKEAGRVLYGDADTERYREMMRRKAVFVQALPEEMEACLGNLPEEVARAVKGRLDAFAASASQALLLDSVFYMYALLYPDEHREGEPNNLEKLAADVAAMAR